MLNCYFWVTSVFLLLDCAKGMPELVRHCNRLKLMALDSEYGGGSIDYCVAGQPPQWGTSHIELRVFFSYIDVIPIGGSGRENVQV